MSKPFDMELFLAAVLTGAHATRERHVRQAKAIQAAITDRWHRDTPWTWQRKHLAWFLDHHVTLHSAWTHYYYLLTVRLLANRLGKSWKFPPGPPPITRGAFVQRDELIACVPRSLASPVRLNHKSNA